MAIKYLSHLETLNIDLQGNQLLNAVVHPDTTANRPASPTTGQIFYNTSNSSLEIWDGSTWTSASGDITGVTAGTGLTGGGVSGGVTVDIDYTASTNLITVASTGTAAASSSVLLADTGGAFKTRLDAIDISLFNNDANYSTTTGTVTSVGIIGNNGISVSGSPVTTAGNITLGLSNVPNSALANSQVTITAGAGLQDGGAVSLGGSVTLNVDYAGTDNVVLAPGAGTSDPTTSYHVLLSDASNNAKYYDVGTLPFAPNTTVSGVTSVAIAGTDGIDVDSGSPITGAGTITLGLSNIANDKLANDDVTFGSTTVALGGSSTSIAGLTELDFAAGNRTIGASIGANSLTVGAATSTVVIPGNLTVTGTTTTVDSTNVNIGDNIITLNSDETGVPSQNAGIEVERGTSANVSFIWNEANDYWSTVDKKFHIGSIGTHTVAGTSKLLFSNGGVVEEQQISTALNVLQFVGDTGTANIGSTAYLTITGNGAISTTASSNSLSISIADASASVKGAVELATTAEVTTGTDATKAVTPDSLQDGYQGSTNVTTLGTITTGVWNGTAIDQAYLVGQSGTNTGDEPDATTSVKGVVELANSTETITGTDTTRAVTPRGASDLVADRIDKHRATDTIPAGAVVHTVAHVFGTSFGVTGVVPIMVSYFDTATGDQLMIDTVQISKDEFEARLAVAHGSDILVSVIYAG